MLFISGCMEQDNSGNNGGGTTGNTVTMTAKEYTEDISTDWNNEDTTTSITMDLKTLEEGDILIIQDTIDSITYDSNNDTTLVSFSWANEYGYNTSLNPTFEGDITGLYKVGDNVKVSVTIKHVTGSYEYQGSTVNYDLELWEEQWESYDYFNSHGGISSNEGSKPMPQSCISAI